MAHFWFSRSTNIRRDDYACYCDTCVWEIRNITDSLAPYWHRGLQLKEGTKVTLALVKQCNHIIMDHLAEIDKPASLETLCGRVIHQHLDGSHTHLPLPEMIKKKIQHGEYEESSNVNEFTNGAKQILGILWQHIGCTIVRRQRHPLQRF